MGDNGVKLLFTAKRASFFFPTPSTYRYVLPPASRLKPDSSKIYPQDSDRRKMMLIKFDFNVAGRMLMFVDAAC